MRKYEFPLYSYSMSEAEISYTSQKVQHRCEEFFEELNWIYTYLIVFILPPYTSFLRRKIIEREFIGDGINVCL